MTIARTKQELLARAQRQYTEVDGVRLQSLTELELTNLNSKWMQRHKAAGGEDADADAALDVIALMRVELLALSIVDENNVRMFTLSPADIDELRTFPKDTLETWYKAARAFNHMDRDEVEANEKKLPEATDSN